VKSPELEIFPRVAVHSTAVSLVPRKLEVNCSLRPECRVVKAGESVRFTMGKRLCERPTVNESWLSPLLLARSVTETTNEYLRAAVGRPEINPVSAFKVSPGGRVPPEIANRYGAVPRSPKGRHCMDFPRLPKATRSISKERAAPNRLIESCWPLVLKAHTKQ